MAKTHDPITSFGAELNAVLRQGANKEVRIKLPDKNLAIRFKQRLNKLRVAMKAAKHPDWEQLYRCGITTDPSDPCTIILRPKDSEFRDFIKGAGVSTEEPPAVTSVSVGESTPDAVDSFLAELTDATSVQKALDENTLPKPDTDKL